MQTQLTVSRGPLRSRSSISAQSRRYQVAAAGRLRTSAPSSKQSVSDQSRRSRCTVIGCAAPVTEVPPNQQTFIRGDLWSLHKFGGTCVSAAERISHAGDVLVQVAHFAPETNLTVPFPLNRRNVLNHGACLWSSQGTRDIDPGSLSCAVGQSENVCCGLGYGLPSHLSDQSYGSNFEHDLKGSAKR